MNFNQVMEALGLEKLASAPAGGHDRAGGGSRASPEPRQPPQQPGPPQTDEPTAEVAAASTNVAADESADVQTPDAEAADVEDDRTDSDAGSVDDDVLAEIRHELDQIAADVDANESQIRGIKSQHEEVIERLDTIEEHNSQLLGVYDRLTAGINPFAESWEARYDRARENPEAADNRYNVIEPPEGAERDPVAPADQAEQPEVAAEAAEPAGDEEDAVGFDELRSRQAAEEEPEEPSASRSPDPPEERADSTRAGRRNGHGRSEESYLSALSAGYASEVLLMEWLTMLIDIAGPPGALKALDYYENIGWISRPVKHQLEDLLGGARVPEDTPARTPGDLTTEEHNRSFAFIMKLARQHQPNPGVRAD